MPQTTYTCPEWQTTFEKAGYKGFDDWWNAEKNLVEDGNSRNANQDSWSHVSKMEIDDGKYLYLKRQQNHFPNNTLLKIRRISTFEIEWENYQKLKDAGIPTLNICLLYTSPSPRDRG